jgi:hypothetical protein
MEKGAILPLFYLPTLEYFTHLITYKEDILLEKSEHFPKQTYRNRASIYSPNGKLDLIIPVVKGSKVHTKMKDVRISYEAGWQRLHWMSLQTCYRSSAYFEFYEHDFVKFYEKRPEFLFDFNLEMLELLMKLLKIKAEIRFTDSYEPAYTDRKDFRDLMNPKKSSEYTGKPYFQVFQDRHGFLPNLSIADLLFNHGPQSISYL